MCSWCKLCPARPGQRTCTGCHCAIERERRLKAKREREVMRQMQENAWRLELLKWRPLTTRSFSVTFYQGM